MDADDTIFDESEHEHSNSSNRLLFDEPNSKQRLSREELLESFERAPADRLKLIEEIQKLRQRQNELSRLRPPLEDYESDAMDGLQTSQESATAGDMTPTKQARQYEYHAQQLDKFLQEYRTLQEQLYKMKESCEGMQKRSSGSKSSR